MVLSYKYEISFDQRKRETDYIKQKYPTKIPIICEKSNTQANAPTILKRKFLVPNDMTVGQFLFTIRQQINITKEQAIFLLIDEKIAPSSSSRMNQIYYDYCNTDGYLYITYMIENTFG